MTILKRLTHKRPILLDGATGTELDRRGVNTALPLWSARALLEAPAVLQQIHADYARAGAEVLTANTFRTHRRSLVAAGLGHQAAALTAQAVAVARAAIAEARPGRAVYVAGSQAPLEDCYSPELAPSPAECEAEHAEMAQHLAAAGVDLILVETMNTIREAVAATRAARATGLPVLTSFVCRSDHALFSGERVSDAVRAVASLGVAGVLINCTPSTTIHTPFAELQAAARAQPARLLVTGLYANIGHTNAVTGWTNTADVSPLEYARLATGWLRLGARVIGGCCGTTPAHIAALRVMLD
ncbi:MAG: homocysteine S-methyltransferase family protein [Anaerolineales bacterium]|nr:homocysteine S-methyltransferase family protein [Anaerolineales bacterium]